MMYVRSLICFFTLLVVFATNVHAQSSIAITAPLTDQVLPTGDDFASTVLGNPWDMQDFRDIAWSENYVPTPASNNVSGGVWNGTNTSNANSPEGPAFVMPLFPGFPFAENPNPLPGDYSLPRFGLRNPINTNKYTLLSIKYATPDHSLIRVSWESDTTEPLPPGPFSPYGDKFDGFNHFTTPFQFTDWVIWSFDLTDPINSFDSSGGDWTGLVHSLQIEMSAQAAIGTPFEIDWIRLVDPNSAPDITINWNSTGISPSDVIAIFVDSDAAGFDGKPLAVFPDGVDPGTYTFPSAILPPNSYYFYILAFDPFVTPLAAITGGQLKGDQLQSMTFSNYSGEVYISSLPRITIDSPSQLSGSSYDEDVLGNAWDMAENEDVFNLDPNLFESFERNFQGLTFNTPGDSEKGGRTFFATSDIPLDPPVIPGGEDNCFLPPGVDLTPNDPNDDPDCEDFLLNFSQIHLRTAPRTPIDSNRFRYANVRMRTGLPTSIDIRQRVDNGHFASFAYGKPVSLQSFVVGHSSPALLYEGWHTYTFDLWDQPIPGGPSDLFQNLEHVSEFVLSPIESVGNPTPFEVDYVELREDVRAVGGSFDIEFSVGDDDSTNLNIGVYYDDDDDGFDGTLIQTLTNVNPGSFTVNWDTSALTDGDRYFIYIVVNDGINVNRAYSHVDLEIGAHVPNTFDTPLDYDGDGKSDPTVFRPSENRFYQDRSSLGFVSIFWDLVPGFEYDPLKADFDGDGRTDLAVRFDFFGYHAYYIHNSGSNTVDVKMWGLITDELAIADYTGNGLADIGVYRDGLWFILEDDGNVTVTPWGVAGDIPVPADYDGDGHADIAIWRPPTGEWFAIASSTANQPFSDILISQHGLAGDIPVPADWDSDGTADPAVWRPSNGTWYVKSFERDQLEFAQWGLPSDIPVVADFNGDGAPDLTVFRPEFGMWFINYRNRHFQMTQFGLADDLLPE